MQLHYRYLLKNRTNLVSNEAGFVTEYRPVYQRQLQIYKGIDNTLEFRVINADQKPVRLTDTPKFIAYDENKREVINTTGTILDDGSTTSTKGLFKVVIADNDTLNLKDQFLTYTVYLDDGTTNTITYNDTSFGACGTMKLNSCAFPGAAESVSVSTFVSSDDVWYSETLEAQPGINGNDALHTAAFYTDSYAGDVVVQATLENQVTGNTDWADIATVTLAGSETEPTPVNFNGVFSHLRFKATADPANKISKILVRN